MGLQKQVNLYRAAGVQGDKATPNQSIYFPKQMVAEGDVTVGTFVFYGTDASKQASNTKTGATAADLVGFVERVINYANYASPAKAPSLSPTSPPSLSPCAAITGRLPRLPLLLARKFS